MMEYKGYLGRVEVDEEAAILHGEIINIRDVVTFQGETVAEVTKAFRDSVDDYLAFCRERGEAPEKPFSGRFVTRVPPELHRRVNVAALLAGKSLNAWVTEQLQIAVERVVIAKAAKSRAAGETKTSKKAARRKTDNEPKT